MANDAHVRMTADDAQALAAWQRQYQAIDGLVQKIERLGKTGSSSAQQMEMGFRKFAQQMFSMNAALGTAQKALADLSAARRDFQEKSAEGSITRDESFRRFRGQAGLRDDLEAAKVKQEFNKIALDTATPGQQIDESATALVSSNVPMEAILGGVLRDFAETLKAAGLKGEKLEPGQLAEKISLFMSATGQANTPENWRKNLVQTQQLYKSGNLQISEMQGLAPDAGILSKRGNMTSEDILSTFTALRYKMDARDASTGLRTSVSRMATIGAFPERTAALEQIGLKPADIDLVGESVQEAFLRIGEGLQKLDEGERAGVEAKIFGEEGGKVSGYMIDRKFWEGDPNDPSFKGANQLRDLSTGPAAKAEFDLDYKLATTGPSADMARAEERKRQNTESESAAKVALFWTEYEAALAEQVRLGKLGAVQAKAIVENSREVADTLGLSGDTVAQFYSETERIPFIQSSAPAKKALKEAVERSGLHKVSRTEELEKQAQSGIDLGLPEAMRKRLDQEMRAGRNPIIPENTPESIDMHGEAGEVSDDELRRRANAPYSFGGLDFLNPGSAAAKKRRQTREAQAELDRRGANPDIIQGGGGGDELIGPPTASPASSVAARTQSDPKMLSLMEKQNELLAQLGDRLEMALTKPQRIQLSTPDRTIPATKETSALG